jgi:hypothetical protein
LQLVKKFPAFTWVILNIRVLRGGVVSTSPNPQAGGPPLVGCPRLLIQFIHSYPPYNTLWNTWEVGDTRGSLRCVLTSCACIQAPSLTCTSTYVEGYISLSSSNEIRQALSGRVKSAVCTHPAMVTADILRVTMCNLDTALEQPQCSPLTKPRNATRQSHFWSSVHKNTHTHTHIWICKSVYIYSLGELLETRHERKHAFCYTASIFKWYLG